MVRIFTVIFERKLADGGPFFGEFMMGGGGGDIQVKQTLSIHVFAYDFYFIQKPSECSEVMCLMHCENGFAVDENGCEVCECAEVIYFCCYKGSRTRPPLFFFFGITSLFSLWKQNNFFFSTSETKITFFFLVGTKKGSRMRTPLSEIWGQ